MKLQFVSAVLAAVASGGSEAARSKVRDLSWSELTGDQRNAAALLGFDQASWDGGEMTLGRFLEGEDMSMQALVGGLGGGDGGDGDGSHSDGSHSDDYDYEYYYGKSKSAKSGYDDYDYDYYTKSAKSGYDDYDYYYGKSAKAYNYTKSAKSGYDDYDYYYYGKSSKVFNYTKSAKSGYDDYDYDYYTKSAKSGYDDYDYDYYTKSSKSYYGSKSAKSSYDDYDYDYSTKSSKSYYGHKSGKSSYDDYDYYYSAKSKSGKSHGKAGGMGKFTAPHEVHQYEQVKFSDEPEWHCEEATVAGVVGCIHCWNPRPADGEALVVEVKSMYKREDLRIKDESTNKPRKHCIFPERGGFYTCFNSNLVIEPDTAWLGELSDKPIYDANGTQVEEGGSCYPGALASLLPDDGSIYY